MDDVPLQVAALPGIIAGPVLRRVTRTKVSVWLALSRPDPVTLHVRRAGVPASEIAAGSATPVRVGGSLWIVVVTGTAPGGQFTAGDLYEYRISSPGWPEPNWGEVSIGTGRPAFPAPPASLDDLTILHTSCRKVHGNGRDGLAGAEELITGRLAAGTPSARPHLLVMSGDQIYADEVPAPLVPRIRRIATDLVAVDDAAPFLPLPAIGGRQARSEAYHLTSSAASDHLWRFGEFLATYLLYWSDTLWPATVPAWADVAPGDVAADSGLDEASWAELRAAVELFRAGLPAVRKVLATVPILMVADDHEVTDDWNLDHPWAEAVYADPAASRIVTNGLLAYVLCQHWGNTPERFTAAGSPEAAVLAAAVHTGASPDTPALRQLLGVPAGPPPPPPSVLRDLTAPGTLRYDFTLGPDDGWPVRLLALDERTAREFHRVDHPAARISLDALALMVPEPGGLAPVPLTFVVAPAPILGTHLVEHLIQPAASLIPGGSIFADFESWSAATANHQELLRRLTALGPLVMLSGDVHFSGTAALTYTRAGTTTRAAQITSSAARNAEVKTMVLHLFGDLAMRLGLERHRAFNGYANLGLPQRAQLATPPPGADLPYDEFTDVFLGRVFRAAQETPTVLSEEIADAYGLTPGPEDWRFEVTPVDDEAMPGPGPLLTDMTAAPSPAGWTSWDPARSYLMLKALRAGDLHRIGRMFVGLPQLSLLEFEATPLEVRHLIVSPVGNHPSPAARQQTVTKVRLV
ncbi:hypothetical protein CcI49_15010 [Frankia sp. CcI49]|uniref:hypothetical protein n=1 Tax=Frankia sp. CcI49 TaxID=1745382 RepID=UPI000975AAFA|nr:hypothetical protein [Frankia sp. CcI49]ONH60007.1 hypothetical protein CcI49_15010 [Frankia sp. CcI49]